MSKSVKTMMLIAAIMLGLGLGAIVTGLAMGGSLVTVSWRSDGLHAETFDSSNLPKAPAAPQAPTAPAIPRAGGYSYQGQEVRGLAIQLGACEALIQEGNDFALDVNGIGPEVTSTVENGVWSITNQERGYHWKGFNNDHQVVTITLPKGFVASQLNLDMGAGALRADSLAANTVYISVGAGEIEIGQLYGGLSGGRSELNCGMGTITVDSAALASKIALNCGMGEIDLSIQGRQGDYGYECTVGMGEIHIGSASTAGLGGKMAKAAPGDNYIVADCGMGSIQVEFEE